MNNNITNLDYEVLFLEVGYDSTRSQIVLVPSHDSTEWDTVPNLGLETGRFGIETEHVGYAQMSSNTSQ